MRYYIKIDRKGYPVSGSLVYTKSKPNNGRWFEIERICPNEDGLCIQPPKPDGYFQRLKYYYVTDECCHPIAGSNIVAYCPPTGNYFEYFPSCLICPTVPPLSASVIITEAILCYGGEATLEVTAEGGFPPYTGTGVFKATAGNQEFIVSDSEDNIVIVIINVTQPGLIMISASSDVITVYGGYSTIDAQASNGVEPYLFQLDNGTPQSSGLFVDVLAGPHEIKVTDANDCENTLPLDITQPAPLVSTISILQEILCYGDLAQIEVTAVGGTPPYTGTGTSSHPAQPGDFNVEVTDYYGNSAQQAPIQITQPALLVIEDVSYAPISVYGGTTSLTVTASGGVSPYTYSVNGTTYGPNPITNVGAGSFTVYVKDANNCITTTPLVITQPAQNFVVCPDCLPTLSGVTNTGVGLLSVGNMTSSTCTLGNYVIDWYLDSTSNSIQFTSGNTGNTDPAIQQFHPFTGAAARPSLGGSWIPVIRYAFFDGIKYTSVYTPGAALATDLEACLDPITVLDLNCNNGTNTTTGFTQYSHKFAYTNGSQVASDASKTVAFTLNSDGSTQYLAWYFEGSVVSDRLKFTYVSPLNSTSTVLDDYAIGTDIPVTNFNLTPKRLDSNFGKYIIDLTAITYATGDYIKIDIIAGYIDPTNTNTNWTIYLKCLETFSTAWTRTILDNCSPTMTFESTLCRYRLDIGFSTFNDNESTDIFKYLVVTNNEVVGIKPTNSNPITPVYFSAGLLSCTATGIGPYNPACTPAAGSITINKTGANWVYTFTNVTDYNKYQTEYNAAIANVTPGGPVPASSDINYYRFIRFWIQKYNNNLCGDTATTNTNVTIHYLTPVTFDAGALTMSFTVTAINPGPYYTTLPTICAGTCSNLAWVGYVNSGASSITNSTVVTGTTQITACDATYYIQATGTDTVKEPYWIKRYVAFDYLVPEYPFPLANGWFNAGATSLCYDYRYICTITDSLDPINNFKIVDKIDPVSGVYLPASTTVVYEIAGGVITTPIGGCP